jgi:peptidoglycan/LPS O-acetylase OafA/YrhL
MSLRNSPYTESHTCERVSSRPNETECGVTFTHTRDNPQTVRFQKHLPALDGIRGIAVLLVLVHHIANSLTHEFHFTSPVTTLLRFGWAGVDLFFVLSGFLITGILIDSKGEQNYFKNFYMRRALRIFPLYFGTLATVGVILRIVPAIRHNFGPEDQGWLWLYATNIVITLRGWDSFGALTHFWSLAVEEHFYLVWPLVVFLSSRRTVVLLGGIAVVGALAVRVASVVHGSVEAGYVLTISRMDGLALGGALAVILRAGYDRKISKQVALYAGGAACVLLGALMIWRGTSHNDPWVQTIGLSLLTTVFGAIISLAVLVSRESKLNHICTYPLLRGFGKYSYGLYVFHPPIFILFFHTDVGRALRASQVLAGTPAGGWADALACSVLASCVTAAATLGSWHLWEKQFLKFKNLYYTRDSARESPQLQST